jgi:Tfp pilus assembly PilM family ATPase
MVILYNGECIYPRIILSRADTWEQCADYIIASIGDNLKYYQFKLYEAPVTRILVTGSAAAASGDAFLERLRQAHGVPASFWNPFPDLCASAGWSARRMAGIDDPCGARMATALGLAIRES